MHLSVRYHMTSTPNLSWFGPNLTPILSKIRLTCTALLLLKKQRSVRMASFWNISFSKFTVITCHFLNLSFKFEALSSLQALFCQDRMIFDHLPALLKKAFAWRTRPGKKAFASKNAVLVKTFFLKILVKFGPNQLKFGVLVVWYLTLSRMCLDLS